MECGPKMDCHSYDLDWSNSCGVLLQCSAPAQPTDDACADAAQQDCTRSWDTDKHILSETAGYVVQIQDGHRISHVVVEHGGRGGAELVDRRT